MPYASLGPEICRPSHTCPGYSMKITEDVRKTVAFIGTGTDSNFSPRGTGFFVAHDEFVHFVTAKHVAVALGDSPCSIRYNGKDKKCRFLHLDPLDEWKWYFHPDDNVDVAILPELFPIRELELDIKLISSDLFYPSDHTNVPSIGVGDQTYSVSLFMLLCGDRLNFPVVHSGTIAAVPSDQLIPVGNWDGGKQGKEMEGYLVEQLSLSGLSGAPVFVRPTLNISGFPLKEGGTDIAVRHNQVFLMGLWQGAWDARPDDVSSREISGTRVPVGMGVVVPVEKIREVLDLPELKQMRDQAHQRIEEDKLPKPDFHEDRRGELGTLREGDATLAKMLNTPPKPHG